jgi:DNA-binding transcriptional ArsR family regulator
VVLSKQIRDVLDQTPDGMTARQLAERLKVQQSSVTHSIKLMPDTYIDRWARTGRRYAAVHCLAFVPEDCPHPKEKT